MIKQRLQALRKEMKEYNIDAYIIPSTDPHQSEYVPALWERRKWISGFTGSAGDVAITKNKAGLWTDSRYFLQAEKELKNSTIKLFKVGVLQIPSLNEWLKMEIKSGGNIGFDPTLFSYNEIQKLTTFFKEWKINLKPIETNLVDKIWKDQPDFPDNPITVHQKKYAGETVSSKLNRLRKKMAEESATAHVISTLDNIAWLFNIRGSDVPYNPVVISYAIVTKNKALFFTKYNKIGKTVFKHFNNQIEVHPYTDFTKFLKKLAKSQQKIWLDPANTNSLIVEQLKENCGLVLKENPITLFKAVKNRTEINGIKSAHIRDGLAMTKFLFWLEKEVSKGSVTEISAANKLEKLRSEQAWFRGPSFNTIAGYGEHGAIVHYAATSETNVRLKPNGIFLIDSGGQYLDGTTDITRTITLGKATKEQKDRFTRILKGHIQLANTRFPVGTAGNQLDTIARKPLWDIGQTYGHGTGHGIGSYLNVHEGPQAISYYRGIGVHLLLNMIISNEPAFYKTGEYGMRIENLIVVVKDDKQSTSESEFYKFETITYCPIDTKLIEKSLLDNNEILWLNEYHTKVRKLLSPHLKGEELTWLKSATKPI